MRGDRSEKLFLLEFLVDKVCLKQCDRNKFDSNEFYSLFVTMKIEDFLCLEINQDALKTEDTNFGTTWHFLCGKSCTFAMQPRKLLNLLKDNPCHFIVGMLDKRFMSTEVIAKCKGSIGKDLSDVILRAQVKRDKFPLSSSIHQDTYNLRCMMDEDVGFISVLVRLTCYGQAVFTRFTCMDGDKKVCYLYENKDPDPCTGMEPLGEGLEFADSDDAFSILKGGEDYGMECQFDDDNQESAITPSEAGGAPCPKILNAPDDQSGTIVCTNIDEWLPESTFQRRFPDDTVPVTPLLSNYEDENIEDNMDCTCLRDMKLKEICKTMFLCDRTPFSVPDESGDAGGVYHPSNPPVRYDTTSCLTAAFDGCRPVPLGALIELEDDKKCLPNPPVRYDTTGALTPAFQGLDAVPPPSPPPAETQLPLSSEGDFESEEETPPCSPVHYDASSVTCRCWCTCYTQMSEETPEPAAYPPSNPPVRYDTTGALTAAAEGVRPVPLNSWVEVADENKNLPNPPVRYDTTGALSPAYQGGTVEDVVKKRKKGGAQAIDWNTRFVIPIPSVAFPKKLKEPWKKSWWYFYKMGDKHPGFGKYHPDCVPEFVKVPFRAGWQWKMYSLPGWRPGVLNKTLNRMFRDVKYAAGMDPGKVHKSSGGSGSAGSAGSAGGAGSAGKGKDGSNAEKSAPKAKGSDAAKQISKVSPLKDDKDDDKASKKKKSKRRLDTASSMELPPTLHIHEQDGNYYIAMQPVNLYPENINIPLQFRIPIPKTKDIDVQEANTRSELRLDYHAPAIYWPPKTKTKAFEMQCDSTEFPEENAPSVEVLMQPKNGQGKGKKPKGNFAASQVVSWDKDPATAVGKVK